MSAARVDARADRPSIRGRIVRLAQSEEEWTEHQQQDQDGTERQRERRRSPGAGGDLRGSAVIDGAERPASTCICGPADGRRGVAFPADGTPLRHRRCPRSGGDASSPGTWRSVSGRAAVVVLGRHGDGHPTFVVGRDPRASGEWLEDALVEGIRSAGGDAILAGVEPTPAIAFLTTDLGASSGVVISASHNPPEYNGIKFFDGRGHEAARRARGRDRGRAGRRPVPAAGVPGVDAHDRRRPRTLPRAPRGGRRGAAGRHVGRRGLRERRGIRARARAARVGSAPPCTRSTPSPTARTSTTRAARSTRRWSAAEVVRRGADAGVSHDGDADRALFADAEGAIVDGDQVLAACAVGLQGAGRARRATPSSPP